MHIQQGVYTIESLNASAYSLTVVCKSKATSYDFRLAIKTMKSHLHGHEINRSEIWEGDIVPASEVEGAAQGRSKVEDDAGVQGGLDSGDDVTAVLGA